MTCARTVTSLTYATAGAMSGSGTTSPTSHRPGGGTVNHEETYDTICSILEAHDEGGVHVEHTADLIMEALERLGEDIVAHLEPPDGVERWLNSHGLSLVPTREVTPPRVWAVLDGDEDEAEEASLEGESGGSLPLQAGEYVEYRTAQSGPRNQSYIGSGMIISIAVNGTVIVAPGPGGQAVFLDPRTDFIRRASSS